MFKKPEIKRALIAICSHEANFAAIAKMKPDPEMPDKTFVRNYASKLYSEELFEYLNDNRFDEFKLVEFDNPSEAGMLGRSIELMQRNNWYNSYFGTALAAAVIGAKNTNGKGERACCVSSEMICSTTNSLIHDGGVEEELAPRMDEVNGKVCLKTYIMESGNVVVMREVSCNGLTLRFPDSSAAPSLLLVQDICSNPAASDEADSEASKA